jgi:hypothetical protein
MATATPESSTATGTPADGGTPMATATSSGETTPFTLLGGGQFNYETLRIAVQEVTLEPASEDGEPAVVDVGGTAIDLATTSSEEPTTILDGVAVPAGSYDTLTMEYTVEEIVQTENSSGDVESGTLTQDLVIGDPASFSAGQPVQITLFLGLGGEGPYTLIAFGWQGTGT